MPRLVPTLSSEEISVGPTRLSLLPQVGGSVGRLSFGGEEVLRPFCGAPSALNTSGFPMLPFSGRIANGAFVFEGRPVRLTPNFPPEPHAIHGKGWQTEWAVTGRGRDRLHLTHVHEGGDWPWAYRAEQVFVLSASRLALTLSLTNLSPDPMPAGLGWHPYFRAAGAMIEGRLASIWRSGPDMIPGAPSPVGAAEDISNARLVADLNLDYAFNAEGAITVCWPETGLVVRLSAEPVFGKRVIYTPPMKDFFCVEPASHSPDALNSPLSRDETGLKVLAQGQTLTGTLYLDMAIQPPERRSVPASRSAR